MNVSSIIFAQIRERFKQFVFQPQAYFQQHDAPLHKGTYVKDYLQETFPGRWIG